MKVTAFLASWTLIVALGWATSWHVLGYALAVFAAALLGYFAGFTLGNWPKEV